MRWFPASGGTGRERAAEALAPSEAAAVARAIEEREREKAKERMLAGRPPADSAQGRAREKVAAAVGMSHDTLKKAREVVEAAEADSEQFGDLVERMDERGKARSSSKSESRTLNAPDEDRLLGRLRDLGLDLPENTRLRDSAAFRHTLTIRRCAHVRTPDMTFVLSLLRQLAVVSRGVNEDREPLQCLSAEQRRLVLNRNAEARARQLCDRRRSGLDGCHLVGPCQRG